VKEEVVTCIGLCLVLVVVTVQKLER